MKVANIKIKIYVLYLKNIELFYYKIFIKKILIN